MPMPFGRIRISAITNFPLSEAQKDVLMESVRIEVTLNKGHAVPDVDKEYTVDLYGKNNPLVTVIVTNISKIGNRTIVTLERGRRK